MDLCRVDLALDDVEDGDVAVLQLVPLHAGADLTIMFLGWIVWGHHMFQSGMNPALGTTFMISTMLIAVPSAIKVFNWMGTMWQGNIRFTVPMLHAVAFVAMFVIGGLSGVFMASTPVEANPRNPR